MTHILLRIVAALVAVHVGLNVVSGLYASGGFYGSGGAGDGRAVALLEPAAGQE